MKAFLALAAPIIALLVAPLAAAQGVPIGELPDVATPTAYRLTLDIDPARPDFAGTAEIEQHKHTCFLFRLVTEDFNAWALAAPIQVVR